MVTDQTFDKLKVCLIIEGDKSSYWGQAEYDGNLIIEEAFSLETLQERMKTLLMDFHNLDPSSYFFEIQLV